MAGAAASKFYHTKSLISVFGINIILVAAVWAGDAQERTPRSQTPQPVTRTEVDRPVAPSSLIQQQTPPGAAKVSPAPAQLSLADAIRIAIANNLATLLAQEQQRAANGVVQQARSALLPNISGIAYQASLTENLAALGFQPSTFPGISRTFIGPFNNFDARARLVQNILDFSAIRNYQSSRQGVRVAEFQNQLAREQVSEATALTYLEALRTDRNVAAAQANVDLASALLQLAQDQRNAGVATGVDVTRAETRLAQERVGLAQAQTAAEQARLNLQRVIGVPQGSTLVLADALAFSPEPTLQPDVAVSESIITSCRGSDI